MDGMIILRILAMVFLSFDLESPSFYVLISDVLYFIGLFALLKKCGSKGWYALIPCLREYKLGQCAGRESEGRWWAVIEGIGTVLNIIFLFLNLDEESTLFYIYAFVVLFLALLTLLYGMRVYSGLCEVFNRKKWWLLLWAGLEWFPALLWGFHPKFQPLWTVQDIQSEASNFFSGAKAQVLDNGLTVNLEERTATEFFKKKYLLRDIHMYIQPGHMVLLLGGSGAGKTTYLNAVNGYEKAKAEVVLNGINMYKHYKEMQYDIGFVPQLDLMRGSDSVYSTLIDAASLRLPKDFSAADRKARVEEVMKIFGLTPVKTNLVSKLSGGQRKRLSIAMEFISNPSLFILDEPDSGLDGVMARELFEQLRRIADQGKIIIVITHTPDRVIDLFDDVIVLAKDAKRTGRLAYFGPITEAREFFGKERMEEIVKSINREEEGGEGRADEFILKYAEVQHG